MARARKRQRRENGSPRPYFDTSKGRWYVQIELESEGGHRRRKKVSAATEQEARDAAVQARALLARGGSLPDRSTRVGVFLDWWISDVVPGTVADGSLKVYRDIVRLYLKPHLGDVRLVDLRPAHVTRMMRALEASGLSPRTQNQARKILARALKRAVAEELVLRNAAADAEGPRVEQVEAKALDLDQAKALLATLTDTPLAPAVMIALLLGLRRGEVLGLTWPDIELDSEPPVVHVRQQLQRRAEAGLVLVPLKTARSRRTLRLPPSLVTALAAHRRRQAESKLLLGPEWGNQHDLVFTTALGTPVDPRNFLRQVGDLTEQAGVGRWHVHALRHSAASILFALGEEMRVVSEVLGHSSERVTSEVYVHLTQDRRDAAVLRLDDALGRNADAS